MMLNDDVKASAAYVEYLSKSLGTQPAKGKRKGKVFEESTQSEGVEAETMDSKETKEEDEIPLVRRPTGVVIGSSVHQELDEKALDHSKKLKAKVLNEGSGVTPAVPDEPSGSSSNSSSDSDDEVEDMSSDDGDKATKKKYDDTQDKDEQAIIEQHENVQAKESVPEPQVEQPAVPHPSSSQTLSFAEYGNQFINDNPKVSLTNFLKEHEAEVQSLVNVPILQQKPTDQRPPLVDTTVTLISKTTRSPNQPPQTQPKRSKTKVLLKKSKKPQTQVDTEVLDNRLTRLERKVDAMSRFNLPKAIDKSV
ncbi:hypothetical protein Tco_0238150 [Tanacetum coccineum]